MNPQIEMKHFPASDFADKNLLCSRWMTQIMNEGEYEPDWANIYRDPRTHVLVLLVNGQAVSSIVYTLSGDGCYIGDVDTNENHRRKGYSKILFTWLINNTTCTLFLGSTNEIATNYYIGLGFKAIYPDSPDCMVLEKK
jgi:hypothetical protein